MPITGAKPATNTLFFFLWCILPCSEDGYTRADRERSSIFHMWCIWREKTQGWIQYFTVEGIYYKYKHDILLCAAV